MLHNSVRYIVENSKDIQWGLSISSVGYEDILPDSTYPTLKHAKGYYFNPEKGRVLDEYQIIYISEGKGTFSTRHAGNFQVVAGTILLLFPQEWHTYQPDKETGWKQYWIGFRGVNIDNRVENNFLKVSQPYFQVGFDEEIIRLYHKAIETARQEKPYFQQLLAGIVNHLIGLMYTLDKSIHIEKDHEMTERINRARLYMRQQIESNISPEQIAQKLGVSYSLFRKQFKEYTGVSPAQYFKEIKIQRAKELLRTTDLSIKEISYSLGFESPDYFSFQFKKKTGYKPGDFRNE